MEINELTRQIIGAAIEVHREMGPGLLESSYQICMRQELKLRGTAFEHEKDLPLFYKGVHLDCGYRLDLLVAGQVIVEIKSIKAFDAVHTAQMLTYLRLTGCKVGLLINFNVPILIEGVKRVVNGFNE